MWMNVGSLESKLRWSAFVISYHPNIVRCDVTEPYTNQTELCAEHAQQRLNTTTVAIWWHGTVIYTCEQCQSTLLLITVQWHWTYTGKCDSCWLCLRGNLLVVNRCVLHFSSTHTDNLRLFVDCTVVSIHANVFLSAFFFFSFKLFLRSDGSKPK